MTDLSKFLDVLNPNPFEEYPVDLETFVGGENYLHHKPLSPIQATAVECMSQIYRVEDLKRFMEPQKAEEFYKKYTKREVILQLGKGCHAPGTPVYNPDTGGWQRLDTHDGNVQTTAGAAYATEAFEEGYGEMLKITFGNFMEEEVYTGHKYLVSRKPHREQDFQFVEASQLKTGDRVVWNRNYTVNNPVNLPDSHLEVLATLMNEHYVFDDHILFRIHYSKPALKKLLVEKYNGYRYKDTPTIVHIEVGDPDFLAIAKQYHSDPAVFYTLPSVLFKCDNETLVRWLGMVYDLAGAVGVRSNSRHGFKLTNMNEHLALDFAHVIMRVGILPSVKHVEEIFMFGPGRKRTSVYVDSFPHNEMMATLLGRAGKYRWRNEHDRTGTKSATILDNYYLVPIKTIKPAINPLTEKNYGPYWTKTVPEHGHYVGNGPISANSGKDLLSTVAVAYVVYKLLCLKDPAEYYGQQSGNAIDIINIAINAQQAKTVFFKNFKNIITKSPWFVGKYSDTQDSISFVKSVTAYSGHSERESHEGLNLIMAVLDEISGFGEGNPLNDSTKSSDKIYTAFSQAVTSRYPDFGKVALLSFPRNKSDFITRHYNEEVKEKEVVKKSHTWVINPDLPETDDNKLTINWEEDHITAYKNEKVWAIRRPSWDVNPLRHIEEYKSAFVKDYYDSLQRFACMPTDMSSDTFFRNVAKIDHAMAVRNPVSPSRIIDPAWRPDPNVTYYVHADLAQQQDKCAVAVAHVDHWTKIEIGHGMTETVPYVVVDMLAWWEPKVEGPVDLSEVKRWIMALRQKGLNLGLVTFDRWGCMTEDTHVYTDTGPVRIKDVSVGDKVLTSNGYSPITAKRDTGIQEVKRITTRQGYSIDVTDEHAVLTKIGWKKAKELVVGDSLLIQKPDALSNSNVSLAQAYVAGALIADGWLNDPKDHSISFTNADQECVDGVLNGLKDGFDYDGHVVKSNRGAATDYRIWSKTLVEKLREFGLGRQLASTKYIPEAIINAGDEAYAEFLAGYIDGDGGVHTYTDRSGAVRYRLTMDTISYRLFEQVKWMVQALGANPSCMRNNNRGGSYSEYYRITLEGEEAERLLSIVKPRIPRKQSVKYSEARRGRWKFNDEGNKWLQVTSIKSIEPNQTFDISVESEEFVANGIVVHNSFDLIRELNDRGYKAETLSVAKQHYEDFAMLLYEERVSIPLSSELKEEMLALKVVKKKVDHPAKASKDLSDAVTGAIFNAISRTPRNIDQTISVHTWAPDKTDKDQAEDVIRYTPEQKQEARDWLQMLGMI